MDSPGIITAIERRTQRFSHWLGAASALLLVALLANVFYDVVMRYLFNDVSIAMQELEWHLFSAVFLLGMAYALSVDAHVRVDLVYERLSRRQRAWIDLVGTVVLLWPFCALVAWYGIDFATESFRLGERSGDPGGLDHRWVIKALIPFAFACSILSSIGFVLRGFAQRDERPRR